MAHSNSVREYLLTDHGLQVLDGEPARPAPGRAECRNVMQTSAEPALSDSETFLLRLYVAGQTPEVHARVRQSQAHLRGVPGRTVITSR